MPLLAYWRYDNYVPDLSTGDWFNFNSKDPRLHSRLSPQDRLWLCTRIDERALVVARFVIQDLTINPPNSKYGEYRVQADRTASSYFADDGRDDARLLKATLRVPEEATSGKLMQSMQRLRELDSDQERLLDDASRAWLLDPRFRRADAGDILQASPA